MNTQQDPRAAYRLSNRNKPIAEKEQPVDLPIENVKPQEQEIPQQQDIKQAEQIQDQKQEDPRKAYRIPSAESYNDDDDVDREIERNIAGLVSRGAEQVVGFAGNAREFAKTIKNIYHDDAILGKAKSMIKEPESFKKFQEETTGIIPIIGSFIDWFPTSSELEKKSSEMTGGFTDPTNDVSKAGQEVFKDIINSYLPGQGPKNIFRNIAIPILSVVNKKGAEYLGFEEKGQEVAKYGTTFLLNMMNRANGPRVNQELWNRVQNTAPNVNLRPNQNAQLLNQAQQLEHQLTLGLGSPSEESALRTVRTFIEKLNRPNQTISAQELSASNRSLNEIVGDPTLLQRGRTLLNGLRETIHEGINYVGHQAPAWVREWRNANQTHGAIQNSNFVANYVSNNYSKPIASEGVRALFGFGQKSGVMAAAGAAAATAPVFAIYKGVQVLNRMGNSPVLYRHYMDAILGSLRGNAAMMSSNLEKLDKGLEKKEKKIPYK